MTKHQTHSAPATGKLPSWLPMANRVVVRRLLSARGSNPTLFTDMKLASVLGMEIGVKTTVSARRLGPHIRKAAKDLTAVTA